MADHKRPPSMDKSAWGDGPWQTEQDFLEWVDGATNLRCMIVRAEWGHLCGYVGVPASHPSFQQDVFTMKDRPAAHGGCNFNAESDTEQGRVWWIGFDCGHAFDLSPGALPLMEKMGGMGDTVRKIMRTFTDHDCRIYRDWGYVQNQVAQLALQLHLMKGAA